MLKTMPDLPYIAKNVAYGLLFHGIVSDFGQAGTVDRL